MCNIDTKIIDEQFNYLISSLAKYGSGLTTLRLDMNQANITDSSFRNFCMFFQQKVQTLVKFWFCIEECDYLTNVSIILLKETLALQTSQIHSLFILVEECGELDKIYLREDTC